MSLRRPSSGHKRSKSSKKRVIRRPHRVSEPSAAPVPLYPEAGSKAKLRLRYRVSPFASILPGLRWLISSLLIIAVIGGGIRWLTHPILVGALAFTPRTVTPKTTAEGVLGIAVSDLDGDDDQDIATAGLDGVKVYINDGKEKFESKIVDGATGERIQIVDLNGDGQQDLLVTRPDGSPPVKWYDNRGGMEFAGNAIGTGSRPKVFAGDINGDSAPDIITSTEEGGVMVLRRWMNNGSGTFTSTTLSSDSKVTAVTVGDLDGNGYRDIVTCGDSGLQRWDTSDGTTWSRSDIDDSNKNCKTHIVVHEMTGDDKMDIVAGDQASNTVAVYRKVDHSTWQRLQLAGEATDATTVVPRDLDEDGDEDIIVAGQDDNSVFWYANNGEEEFTKATIAGGIQSVFGVAVADLDSDNDFDIVAGDHFQGAVYWYERALAKPVATAPSSIEQASDGSGKVTFKTTLSDEDGDTTRIRVQYSTDGKTWYKPWMTKVTPSVGSVDLKNSNGYQIGTSNAIDSTSGQSVDLTIVWDTKSAENTGGPIKGDVGTVQLRVLPRDRRGTNGATVVSNQFRVDNAGPTLKGSVRATPEDTHSITLRWQKPSDSGAMSYKIYYGTNEAAVIAKTSDVWDKEDDEALADTDAIKTTITGLTTDKTYAFKLVVTDAKGNESAFPVVRSKTSSAADSTDDTGDSGDVSPTGTPPPTDGSEPTTAPEPTRQPTSTPLPTPTSTPSVLDGNDAPLADAGRDQVVNPGALVVLDGASSSDPDRDSLSFSWRQLDGPQIDILSPRTATPSFTAGQENETYIFALTVRDSRGASATDTVTIATRTSVGSGDVPPDGDPGGEGSVPQLQPESAQSSLAWLRALNMVLLVISLLSTALLVAERVFQSVSQRKLRGFLVPVTPGREASQGKVVHYQTGTPIAGANVLIYDKDHKLRATERTNAQGGFSTLLPPGEYSLVVEASNFTFAATAALAVRPQSGLLYTGGTFTVRDASQPLTIVVPMKPTVAEVSSLRTQFLHVWQTIQRIGRWSSWPLFITGALLNTLLVFLDPRLSHLVIEVLYVFIIIIKIAIEIRTRPAYGLVRDAITHVPLDLAVVRLLDAETNRLVMTRVTNTQGKFFALPPPGTYTITVTKPGYGTFTKPEVVITDEHDATLQMTADLMPMIPHGSLQQARAAVI
jgi:hypothetical protein